VPLPSELSLPADPRSGSRFSRVFAAAWILLALISAAWSIATPLGGSPDEPAHIIKAAAVARGELIGKTTSNGQQVRVPAYVAYEQTCFAFHPNVSAACATTFAGAPDRLVNASTSAGLYNPLYYALVGWPSLIFTNSAGIFAMRIVSGILVSLFLAFALGLIATWRRPTLPVIGFAVAITPMTLFLSGAVNPNSLEISATLAAFVGILTITREGNPRRLGAVSALVFVSASIAANMRGLSLLWLAVAILSPFVLLDRRRITQLLKTKAVQRAIVGTAIACAGAVAWLLRTDSLGPSSGSTGPVAHVPGMGDSAASGFIWTLSETLDYARGVVGDFGWLDTPAPDIVNVIWSLFVGGLLVFGLVFLRGRNLLLAAILFAAVVLLPAILQGIYIHSGGVIWQGRYILPLFVCLVLALGSSLGQCPQLRGPALRRLLTILVSLWAIAQFAAFATTLKRYAVGLDSGWLTILHPRWSPPGGIVVSLGTLAIVLVACAFCTVLMIRRVPEELEGTESLPPHEA